jgi:hypothetical protein
VKNVPSLVLVPEPDKTFGVTTVVAIQHVRRMRGGAQAQLMRCSDKHFYVVKFQNNPQHLRVLANEMLGTLLAQLAGLPVPQLALVEVSDWMVDHTPQLRIELAGSMIPCKAGLQFGSRYVVNPLDGQVFDYLPADSLKRVRNLETFAGILAMDKWTCNTDGRQATFWRRMRQHYYSASFIDQGYCFNGGEWTFPDSALRGVSAQNEVYVDVLGWDSFEPWLSRMEDMRRDVILAAAAEIPLGWYKSDSSALESMVRTLIERRTKIRGLLTAFRLSCRRPFPNWGEEGQPKAANDGIV